MTSGPHSTVQDVLPGYINGTASADERQMVTSHLDTCAECRDELMFLIQIKNAVVKDASSVPAFRTQIRRTMAAIDGLEPARTPGAWRRLTAFMDAFWNPQGRFVQATLAVQFATIVVLAGFLMLRQTEPSGSDLEARLEQVMRQASAAERALIEARRATADAQSAMAVLVAPDLARIDLAGQSMAPQARARALWSRSNGMLFTVSNLPSLPEGRVYQVWVVTDTAPISAGLLTPDATGRGMVFFSTPPDLPAPVAVAVTLEPAGGVPAPTGERFLIGMPDATL